MVDFSQHELQLIRSVMTDALAKGYEEGRGGMILFESAVEKLIRSQHLTGARDDDKQEPCEYCKGQLESRGIDTYSAESVCSAMATYSNFVVTVIDHDGDSLDWDVPHCLQCGRKNDNTKGSE